MNEYHQDVTGGSFTAKDFRTWGASVSVAAQGTAELDANGVPGSAAEAYRRVVAAVEVAAARLANTPAVCRSSYVRPAVVASYPELLQTLDQRAVERTVARLPGLGVDECRLLVLLERAEPTDLGTALAAADPGT